jgi:hypothetical protein
MKPEIIISIVSTGVAILAFTFSFYVFWINRISRNKKERKNEQMQIITSFTLMFWDQLQTLISAKTHSFSVDDYVYDSLRKNALRLEGSIQNAISIGLWNEFVSDKKPNALAMHNAFIQNLVYNSSQDINDIDHWLKEHLLMGVIRVIEICENFNNLDDSLKQSLRKQVPKEMRDIAWVYLQKHERS